MEGAPHLTTPYRFLSLVKDKQAPTQSLPWRSLSLKTWRRHSSLCPCNLREGALGPPAETPSKHADHRTTLLGTLRSWTSQPGPAHGTATVTIDLGQLETGGCFWETRVLRQFLPMA